MKKIITIISLFFSFAVFNTACKKTYECSCVKADGTHEHFEIKEKKSDADAVCKAKAAGSYTACAIE